LTRKILTLRKLFYQHSMKSSKEYLISKINDL
jgi:hypothetical protein